MGEILAVGITHYPPLAGRDETMTWILKRMLQNPGLPEKYRSVENWPAPMREEWSNDEGASTARLHREMLLAWLRKVRAAIDDFNPDFILIWGDDQYENFKEDIIPPYCIYAYDSIEFSPPPHNVWDEPAETRSRRLGLSHTMRRKSWAAMHANCWVSEAMCIEIRTAARDNAPGRGRSAGPASRLRGIRQGS